MMDIKYTVIYDGTTYDNTLVTRIEKPTNEDVDKLMKTADIIIAEDDIFSMNIKWYSKDKDTSEKQYDIRIKDKTLDIELSQWISIKPTTITREKIEKIMIHMHCNYAL